MGNDRCSPGSGRRVLEYTLGLDLGAVSVDGKAGTVEA